MPINVSMREDANSGTCRKEQGFTLVEVIVVLSVVLLLTGIAVPMLSTYMEDGRRARAESECKTIGAAVLGFYKDVGVYPARNSSSSNNTLTVLMTGPSIPSTSPWMAAHAWITEGTGSNGDVLDNHLVLNQPQSTTGAAYPMTGVTRWRGPYTGPLPVDPWGRPYAYLNIAAAGGGVGGFRKDKNLNPLNTDFDLYSSGKDGASSGPLSAQDSRDDIVRANNGSFIGKGEDY